MRFYDIQLTDPKTGKLTKRWQSFPNGVFDPNAQNIVLDFMVTTEDIPLGGSSLSIEGISLQDLQSSVYFGSVQNGSNFIQGQNIAVYGGMGRGLPLANPAQAGLILQGFIWQSYGNWHGVEMSLDFAIKPSTAFVKQQNIGFNWLAGTPLSQALQQTFSGAFPGMAQSIKISANRVLGFTESGNYTSVDRFASYLKGITAGQLNQNDPGVSIVVQGGTVYAFDGTQAATPIKLLFTDLVKQPTWLQPYIMQVTTVMRGDIAVGDTISMPAGLTSSPGQVSQNPFQGLPGLRQSSVFTGNFIVQQIRHLGNFRSADGLGWISIFNCVPA